MVGGVETRAAVLGWYGHGNFGDELILHALHGLLKAWEIKVFTNDFTGAYPFMDFAEVNKCDLFVLGGGELISSDHLFLPSRRLYYFKVHSVPYRLFAHTPWAFPSWVHKVKVPKIILGCGVNGNCIDTRVLHELEQFWYIGVRDKTALSILQAHPTLKDKVHLFFDLTYSLQLEPETLQFLAKAFPCKLHGYILSHMANMPYKFSGYHRKVQRVQDTVQGLSPHEIRGLQKTKFDEMLNILKLPFSGVA